MAANEPDDQVAHAATRAMGSVGGSAPASRPSRSARPSCTARRLDSAARCGKMSRSSASACATTASRKAVEGEDEGRVVRIDPLELCEHFLGPLLLGEAGLDGSLTVLVEQADLYGSRSPRRSRGRRAWRGGSRTVHGVRRQQCSNCSNMALTSVCRLRSSAVPVTPLVVLSSIVSSSNVALRRSCHPSCRCDYPARRSGRPAPWHPQSLRLRSRRQRSVGSAHASHASDQVRHLPRSAPPAGRARRCSSSLTSTSPPTSTGWVSTSSGWASTTAAAGR